jgi:hypothetical protein
MSYEVRQWDYDGLEVGAEDCVHDGAGTIYLAWQVTNRDRSGAPKECHVRIAISGSTKSLPHMTIPEIYGPPQFYITQTGMAIVHGKDETQKHTSKISVAGWVARSDVRK